jgi:hypothetical protein
LNIFSDKREEKNSGHGQAWVVGLFVSLLAIVIEPRVFFLYQPHAYQVTDVQADFPTLPLFFLSSPLPSHAPLIIF